MENLKYLALLENSYYSVLSFELIIKTSIVKVVITEVINNKAHILFSEIDCDALLAENNVNHMSQVFSN